MFACVNMSVLVTEALSRNSCTARSTITGGSLGSYESLRQLSSESRIMAQQRDGRNRAHRRGRGR